VSIEPDHDLAVTQQGHYAGAVTRLVAFIVDQAVVTAVFSIAVAATTYAIDLVADHQGSFEFPTWALASSFALWWILYYSYSWATSGKTFGMAVLGLRVVRRNGEDAGVRSAVLRTLSLPLSFLLFGLGFVGIITNREHRALHDRIADTAVVYDWDARAARLRFLARSNIRPGAAVANDAAPAPGVVSDPSVPGVHADAG
jgi:uncharacterized RDD family membrane protein YckC